MDESTPVLEAEDHLRRIPCLDKGYVELLSYDAEDLYVVNAARVSFAKEVAEMDDKDTGLLKFLMRERHGTPFEHNSFRFRVKAPIFVFREWHRHRIGHSYNEWSARYSQLEPEFYIPSEVVTQTGKPGNYTFEPIADDKAKLHRRRLEDFYSLSYELYEEALTNGVAKQQARLFNPVGIYSQMHWTCNARSIMTFLSLRNAANAQAEIREYAQAVESFFRDVMPITADAFVASGRVAP